MKMMGSCNGNTTGFAGFEARGALLSVSFLACVSCLPLFGNESRDALLEKAEDRLRSIYQKGEFRSKRFSARWLPDSSGYTREETEKGKKVSVVYEVDSGDRSAVDPGAGKRQPPRGLASPDGSLVLIRERGNLKVRGRDGGELRMLTDLKMDGASITKTVWSPDSGSIAFLYSDSSKIPFRSMIVPGDPSYPEVREMRFARVGGEIPQLKVGVAKANGDGVTWLDLSGSEDGFYLGQVDWAENSDEVLVEKLSRFRDEREFLLFDVNTGQAKKIFQEKDPAWVVASYGKNLGLEWLKGGTEFLVLSEKDGWRHAYVYSREGEELRRLTPGDFDIIEKVKVDEKHGWFYFSASPENATQKYLYRVPLDGAGERERLTPLDQPGYHDYDISPDGRWAFQTRSNLDTPPVTELVELPGHRSVRVLEGNERLRKKVDSLPNQGTDFLVIDIGEGIELDAWMIKPSGFDASKKYPVLVYVYGEPHGQTVLDRWNNSSADYHRAIAELGYVVVSIDNRGTPAPKGAAWRRSVFGSLGPLSTEEQARGLKEMAKMCPFLDLSRVGIWGWSGGGSNTLNAMFRKPELYQVGIAVVPKPQPHLYNAWFQEIYMETRETNPEGYKKSAPIHFADGLEGDLLIIHGTGETNTHLQIVEGLVDRLIELGKPFDYMAYPNRNHGISEGKGTSYHMRMLMARYLIDHLPPGPASD